MKNIFKTLVVAGAFLAINSDSYGQATATANASATIVTPISITKTQDMNFGNIAVSASTGGTVVLAPAGTRTATGGVTLPATTGTVQTARFTVNGEGSYTYAITLPSTAVELNDGASHTMELTTFTSNPSATGTLSSGTQTLNVGATITVAAGQTAGTYTTTSPFSVTVNYN